MKVTKRQLKQIIKEELEAALEEGSALAFDPLYAAEKNAESNKTSKELRAAVLQAKGEEWWRRNIGYPGLDFKDGMIKALGPWAKDNPGYDPNDLKKFGLA